MKTNRILVVDDEEIIHMTIDRIFRDTEYQIEHVHNAMDALERIQEGFSVVITDIRMPGIDGIELLRRIKLIDNNAEVIVMTGYATLETAMKAKRYGAMTYITKPLEDATVLKDGVNKAITQRNDTRKNEQLYNAIIKGQVDSLVVNGENKIIPFFRDGGGKIVEHLLGTLNNGMVFLDVDGFVTFSNIKFPQTLGYSYLDVIGKAFLDYVHGQDQMMLDKLMEMVLKEGRGLVSELRLKSSSGRPIPVMLNAVCIHNNEDNIEDILIIVSDLSDLKTVQAHIEKMARLVDQAKFEAIIIYDHMGNVTDCNQAAENMIMVNKSMILGSSISDLFHDVEQDYFEFQNTSPSKGAVVEALVARIDGSSVPVEFSVSTLEENESEEEHKSGGMVFVRDITDRKRDEKLLAEQKLELEKNNAALEQVNIERQRQYDQSRRLMELNPDGMLVVDHNNHIIFSNPAATFLFNREAGQLQGEQFDFPISVGENTEINIGDDNIVEMDLVPIDWDGENAHLVTLHDITARKITEAKLIQLAQNDQLTGLANRSYCLDYLLKSLARAKRRNGYIAILFLDLDKFKDINDSLGHDEGDELLKSVAKRLNRCVREGDLAARFGGDEFALILDEINKPEDAGIIAQNIIDSMTTPHLLKNKPTIIGCSIGIATFPLCGEEPEDLFKAADIAMYHAKSRGRNNYQFFADKMQQQLTHRLRLEHDLRQAIQRDELLLNYQPQIDSTNGNIVAMEALLRWQHPDLGFISPDTFIPLAERIGLISEIGEWVLQTACDQSLAWTSNTTDEQVKAIKLVVAINVSIIQLNQGKFIEKLERVLKDTGYDPHYIEIELTESTMMADPEAVIVELNTIQKMGISIAVDDFGTGYSSLSYLRRLSLSTLKIDQSFVAEIGVETNSEVLIKTIIAMAHSLEMRTIAEGVETAEQAAFLKEHSCDLLQGYYYSKPLPYEEITMLLSKNNETNC